MPVCVWVAYNNYTVVQLALVSKKESSAMSSDLVFAVG